MSLDTATLACSAMEAAQLAWRELPEYLGTCLDPFSLDWRALLVSQLTWSNLPGAIGVALVGASSMMRRMIPLRRLAVASTVFLIAYYYLQGGYLSLLAQVVVLPMSCVALYQMTRLVRRVKRVAGPDHAMSALKPYMKRRHCRTGDILFRQGDVAHELYFIISGGFRVTEIGLTLPPGQFVGELGLFAPNGRRTQSLECVADGELLSISYEHVLELYFQNPEFGLHFLKLTTSRLLENNDVLKAELDALRKRLDTPRKT